VKAQRKLALAAIKAIPARQEYLSRYQQARETARQLAPEIFRKDTPQQKMASAILQQCPELVRIPDHDLFLAWAVRGAQAYQAEAAGSKVVTVDPKAMKAAGERLKARKAEPPAKAPVRAAALPGGKPAPKPAAPGSSKAEIDKLLDGGDLDGALDRLLA
jgi:hypothetical protein